MVLLSGITRSRTEKTEAGKPRAGVQGGPWVRRLSEDMFETSERVHTADSNYAPFQPGSSGNSRVLTILRRMVIGEQDEAKGTLWLLRVSQRRWFGPVSRSA
jgi:hypothetical protein